MSFAENESKKSIRDIATKAILNVAPLGLGSILYDLIEARRDEIKRSVIAQQEKNLNDFHEKLLHCDFPIDASQAEPLLDDPDFHALLKSCSAEVESEKIEPYARLIQNIASGRVQKESRRHFILSLSKLSFAQLELMKKAYISAKYRLKPSVGGGQVEQREFLAVSRAGTIHSINIFELTTCGFIDKECLTQLGIDFVQSIFRDSQLTPAAINHKTWSNRHYAIVCYELGNSNISNQCLNIQTKLYMNNHKTSILAVLDSNLKPARLLATDVILVLGDDLTQTLAHLQFFEEFCARKSTILINTNAGAEIPQQLSSFPSYTYEEWMASPSH